MKKFLTITFTASLFFALFIFVKGAPLELRGPSTVTVTFPIKELGGCTSKQECKTYCDKPENISACTTFAQGHGLISNEEKQRADKFSEVLKQSGGPGGCKDAEVCKTYCSDPANTDTCVAFAQTNNLLPKQKLDDVKKIGDALKAGGGPGGCKNDSECKTFCSKS